MQFHRLLEIDKNKPLEAQFERLLALAPEVIKMSPQKRNLVNF